MVISGNPPPDPFTCAYAKQKQSKDVYCVMVVGMYLYAQVVQTKNKQCISTIIGKCSPK